MSSKRPETSEEILALPKGPFMQHERVWTLEDHHRGTAVVNGKTVKVRGRSYGWYEDRPVMANKHEYGDTLGCWDDTGNFWTLGQWADGTWFRELAPLPI